MDLSYKLFCEKKRVEINSFANLKFKSSSKNVIFDIPFLTVQLINIAGSIKTNLSPRTQDYEILTSVHVFECMYQKPQTRKNHHDAVQTPHII